MEPWLNLNAAKFLQIASKTLRLAAQAREIEAIHPLPQGLWIFARAAQNGHYRTRGTPRDRIPANKAPSPQSHSKTGVLMPGCSDAISSQSRSGLR
jgi:hypothetical protein